MRTSRSMAGLIALAAATTVAAQQPPTFPITSADAAMRYHLSLEYQVPPPRLWVQARTPDDAAKAPSATGSDESADQRLQRIVGAYARERLHHNSWFNPWARPAVATPDPLAAVAPGDGVTSPGAQPPLPPPQQLAGQGRP